MVLPESEAEARLAQLRRERETLDRAIADLTLYLELGRRLRTGPTLSQVPTRFRPTEAEPIRDEVDPTGHDSVPALSVERGESVRPAPVVPPKRDGEPISPGEEARLANVATTTGKPGSRPAEEASGSAEGVLSDGVLARRHGRALIEAALAVLDEAGRPLHAGEILAALTSRGFSLPGHDPVAALNTRLWKRSGPGGPFRRMGDAVYALAEPEDE